MAGDALEGEIAGFLARALPDRGFTEFQPLAGDASTRRYVRARGPGGPVVVMRAPAPEDVARFAAMTGLMRSLGVDVPAILAAEGAMAALEDLGDTLLETILPALDSAALEKEYHAAVDRLVSLQLAADAWRERSAGCFHLAFDREKLTFETEFAHEHFMRGYLGLALSDTELWRLRRAWEPVIAYLAARTETLAHRDLHARNIMIHGARRVWIDYQDARMGRRTYDLASLLYDPYAALAPEFIGRLADYYYARLSERMDPEWDREGFLEQLGRSAAQRLYKALGTYGYQTAARGAEWYVKSIPPAARHLARLAAGDPALKPIGAALAPVFARYG